MNKSKKKEIVLIGVILIIGIIILVSIYIGNISKNNDVNNDSGKVVEEKEDEKYLINLGDGTQLNNSEDMKETIKYKNLEMSNIQFTQKDGKSVLLADVKNTGSSKHDMEIVKLLVFGDNDEVLVELFPLIGNIEPGATIKFNTITTANIANAKYIRIEDK